MLKGKVFQLHTIYTGEKCLVCDEVRQLVKGVFGSFCREDKAKTSTMYSISFSSYSYISCVYSIY